MKKIIITVLMVMMAIFALTGCGGESQAGNAGGQNSTLQKVLKSGTLKVGIILSSAPMGSVDANGKAQGYDVDSAQALADALGVKLELVDMAAAERIPALETGKVDIIIGILTRNVERAAKIAFTDPYFVNPAKIITLKGSNINLDTPLSELKGLKIGATKGGSTAQILEKSREKYGYEIFLGSTQPELVAALENKQIAGFAIDGSVVDYSVLKQPEKYQRGPVISEPYYNSMGVRIDDLVWLQYLNTFIKEMNAKHFFQDLYVKYYGVENKFSLTPTY